MEIEWSGVYRNESQTRTAAERDEKRSLPRIRRLARRSNSNADVSSASMVGLTPVGTTRSLLEQDVLTVF